MLKQTGTNLNQLETNHCLSCGKRIPKPKYTCYKSGYEIGDCETITNLIL